jgi:hypothetical protein
LHISINASKLQIHASDYLQATSLTTYQHKHASCPSSSKKKQTRKQRKKEDFTFSADDEPSWRGGLGSARTNYSGTWNPRNKMQIFCMRTSLCQDPIYKVHGSG